jgi:hypothetical protein
MIKPIPQNDKATGTKLVLFILNPLIWSMPFEKRYEKLNSILSELSEYTIITHFDAIMWIIRKQFSKSMCLKYKSSEKHYEYIAGLLPSIAHYKSRILETIRKSRRKAGIK